MGKVFFSEPEEKPDRQQEGISADEKFG